MTANHAHNVVEAWVAVHRVEPTGNHLPSKLKQIGSFLEEIVESGDHFRLLVDLPAAFAFHGLVDTLSDTRNTGIVKLQWVIQQILARSSGELAGVDDLLEIARQRWLEASLDDQHHAAGPLGRFTFDELRERIAGGLATSVRAELENEADKADADGFRMPDRQVDCDIGDCLPLADFLVEAQFCIRQDCAGLIRFRMGRTEFLPVGAILDQLVMHADTSVLLRSGAVACEEELVLALGRLADLDSHALWTITDEEVSLDSLERMLGELVVPCGVQAQPAMASAA